MKRLAAFLALSVLLFTSACAQETRLCELARPHGFRLGAVFSHEKLRDDAYLSLLREHCNTLTCENETKAYSLLDQSACQRARDGMPAMNWRKADEMLAFARDNGLHVRGHVLVWDAYMPDWFFREKYRADSPFVDRDTMCARLESYIHQVISHFETEFPGVIDCWDVVNEAIGDSAGEWDASDARHIRTTRGGVSNLFRDVIGNDYVELAFLYARDAVDATGADIRLFYNDYNLFYDAKRASACALAQSINSYAGGRRLVDGIGMQGYIGGYGQQQGCLNPGDIARIQKSIETYADLGLEVQITEMAVRNYDPDEAERHAQFCARLFEAFKAVNSGERKPLTNVSIWGLVDCSNLPKDHYTYKLNSPYCGLFDLAYQPKASFEAVLAVLQKP